MFIEGFIEFKQTVGAKLTHSENFSLSLYEGGCPSAKSPPIDQRIQEFIAEHVKIMKDSDLSLVKGLFLESIYPYCKISLARKLDQLEFSVSVSGICSEAFTGVVSHKERQVVVDNLMKKCAHKIFAKRRQGNRPISFIHLELDQLLEKVQMHNSLGYLFAQFACSSFDEISVNFDQEETIELIKMQY